MTTTMTGVSAIMVSYQTGPVLRASIAALLQDPICHELILVNNGNPPEIVDALRAHAREDSRLKILDGHGNIGFGRGCNLGADQARCAKLVFVNPDCIIDEGTMAAFDAALRDNPLALLGGALRNEDGSEQRGCRRGELSLWSAVVSFLGLGKPGEAAGIWRDFNRDREPSPMATVPMPVVSGALMAVSSKTFEGVGGFDARYFLHVEDVDLCVRVRREGQKVLFVPGATALHIGATSDASSWTVTFAKINSFGHYFWTHASGLIGRLRVIAVMPFLALAMIARSFLR
jgi:N-acetylglucosaminyl-diphospho-decaprenol L-rhamnosyltransferase